MSEQMNSRMNRRVLSIGLAAILVLSSIVVALPVNAQQNQPSITLIGGHVNNRFFGPVIIAIQVTHPGLASDDAPSDITVNGDSVKAIRSGTNIYAMVADRAALLEFLDIITDDADNGIITVVGATAGDLTADDLTALTSVSDYNITTNANSPVKAIAEDDANNVYVLFNRQRAMPSAPSPSGTQPAAEVDNNWPAVRLISGTSFTIGYANANSVTLTRDENAVKGNIQLTLDRPTVYPRHAEIIPEVRDAMLNVNPWEPDIWYFHPANTGSINYQMSSNMTPSVIVVGDPPTMPAAAGYSPDQRMTASGSILYMYSSANIAQPAAGPDADHRAENAVASDTDRRIRLEETDDSTNIFTSEVSDEDDRASIYAGTSGTFTISYRTTTLTRNISTSDSTVSLDKAAYGGGDTATVTVNDADLNLRSKVREEIPARESRTWIKVGNPVTLTNANGVISANAVEVDSRAHAFTFRLNTGSSVEISIDLSDSEYNAVFVDRSGLRGDNIELVIDEVEINSDGITFNDDDGTFSGDITIQIDNLTVGQFQLLVVDFINIEATTGTNPLTNLDFVYRIPLREDAVNSSRFTGSVQFFTANPLDARIDIREEVAQAIVQPTGSTIRTVEAYMPNKFTGSSRLSVAYNDTDSLGSDRSSTGELEYRTSTGSLRWEGTYSINDRAVIILEDKDLNRNPAGIDVYEEPIAQDGNNNTARNFYLTIGTTRITTMLGNTNIKFVETGENTGVFRAELQIPATVNDDDIDITSGPLKINYRDFRDSDGNVKVIDASTTIRSVSTLIQFEKSVYPPAWDRDNDDNIESDERPKVKIIVTDPGFNRNNAAAEIETLEDFDEDTPGSIKVTLKKGGTSVTLTPDNVGDLGTMRETGVNTGKFEITFRLNDKYGSTPITDGFNMEVTYVDSTGNQQTAIASIRTSTATISTDKTTYDYGETIILRINEPDWNMDPGSKDRVSISARVLFTSDQLDEDPFDELVVNGVELDPSSELEETEDDSGIFEIKIKKLNPDIVGRNQQLEIKYEDSTPSGGGDTVDVLTSVLLKPVEPTIILDKDVYTPYGVICLQIFDPGANTDPESKDNLFVSDARLRITVGGVTRTWNSDDPDGNGIGEFEETDTNSGLFRFRPTTYNHCILISDDDGENDDTELNGNARAGDGIRIEYRTAQKEITITKTASIRFNDGSISFDKEVYKVGDRAVITIEDPDENRDPASRDSFTIKVISDTDPAGIKITMDETGPNTGKFTGTVDLQSGVSSGSRLQVSDGDQITAIYTDETLPDAQNIRQALVNRDQDGLRTLQTRDVAATATIGVSIAPTERFAVQQPRTVDQAGNPTTPQVNVPVSIASQIKNNTSKAMDYVYIVQVKDENGIVVSISTVSSTLDPGRTANVSASWMPTAPGTYTIETFVWSELGKPSPLSPVQKITVTVA